MNQEMEIPRQPAGPSTSIRITTYRQTLEEDTPAILKIREATWGGESAPSEMRDRGFTHDSVLSRMRADHSGWIAYHDGVPVGVAMADRSKGEVWMIAVLPEYTGRRIEMQLARQSEGWLFSHGWKEIRWVESFDGDGAADILRASGWVESRAGAERGLMKVNPQELINLEEHVIADPVSGYTRIVRLQRGPSDRPHRLCLFLDGEQYWRDMDAVPVVNALAGRGEIPEMTLAFIGHVSAEARHEDYTCNEGYGRFVSEAVVPWLKKEVPGVRNHDHGIVGLSLSGLMATWLTLRYPQHFSRCLSQSGSYWWDYDWFERMARERAPVTGRFWLSVGDRETQTNVTHPPSGLFQEISQIAGVEKMASELEQLGAKVRCRTFEGGHSIQPWRDELSLALPWLLKP